MYTEGKTADSDGSRDKSRKILIVVLSIEIDSMLQY